MINNQNNFYYIIFYFIGYYEVISCKIKKEAHFRRVTLQKNALVHAGIIAICMIFVNSLFRDLYIPSGIHLLLWQPHVLHELPTQPETVHDACHPL